HFIHQLRPLNFDSIFSGDAPTKCDGGQADMLFILDSSGSIGFDDYSRQLKFAADLTGEFI
ncbi:unnamed protein product, partial [Candidula unifasciata]